MIEMRICREIATSSADGFVPSTWLGPRPSRTMLQNPDCNSHFGEAIPMQGPTRSASRHGRNTPTVANVTHRASLSSSPRSIDCGRIRIPGRVDQWKSESRQQVMTYWHRPSVGFVLTQQFSIAALGHPLGSRQVSGVNFAAPLRVVIRVQSEQDLHGLAPIGSVPVGIEEAQIKRHMLTIIGREFLALRRFIQEWRCRALHQR